MPPNHQFYPLVPHSLPLPPPASSTHCHPQSFYCKQVKRGGWLPPHSFSILHPTTPPPATSTHCHPHPLYCKQFKRGALSLILNATPFHSTSCHPHPLTIPSIATPLPLLPNHPTYLKLFGNKGVGGCSGLGRLGVA